MGEDLMDRAIFAPTQRWTPSRKEAVVRRVTRKEITVAQACAEYLLGEEELAGWIDRFSRYGRAGLSVHRLQMVRR